jgi:hypothetical protein
VTKKKTFYATGLLVVDSLHENPEKQFSQIVSDVLASQSEPVDLLTSPSETNAMAVGGEDGYDERKDFIRTSSVHPFDGHKNKFQSFHHYHQPQQQQEHFSLWTTDAPSNYKSTQMPFKPTGSGFNSGSGQVRPSLWSSQSSLNPNPVPVS